MHTKNENFALEGTALDEVPYAMNEIQTMDNPVNMKVPQATDLTGSW